jgi:hypothetical protein
MGLKKVFFSTLAVCLLVGASGATLAKAKKGGQRFLKRSSVRTAVKPWLQR